MERPKGKGNILGLGIVSSAIWLEGRMVIEALQEMRLKVCEMNCY